MALTGIDVSRHQGSIHWPSVGAHGHAFAFLKATDGIGYSYVWWFHQNRPLAWNAGLLVGAYHFLLDQHHGGAQAEFYVREVNRSGGFYGVVPILDVEREADGTTPGIRQVREFVARFRELVPGRPILIYTGRWYWVGVIGNPLGVDLGPLWHSEYDGITPFHADVINGPELDNYGGWPGAKVWQHTSSGSCPGVNGRVDLNLFYGSYRELQQLAGVNVEPPPERKNNAMSRYAVAAHPSGNRVDAVSLGVDPDGAIWHAWAETPAGLKTAPWEFLGGRAEGVDCCWTSTGDEFVISVAAPDDTTWMLRWVVADGTWTDWEEAPVGTRLLPSHVTL